MMVHLFVPPVYSLDTLWETWRLQYSRGAYHFLLEISLVGFKSTDPLRGIQTPQVLKSLTTTPLSEWYFNVTHLTLHFRVCQQCNPQHHSDLKNASERRYTFQIQHSEQCFKLAPLYNQSYNMPYIAFPETSQPPKHQDFAFMLFQHTRMGPCSIQNNVPRPGPRVARHWACLTTSAGLGTCLHKWDRKWPDGMGL